MEYPHRPYLVYLTTRRYNNHEIAADCTAKGLMVPNDATLTEVSEEVGTPPRSWKSSWKQARADFKRWLRRKGVLELWRKDEDVVAAFEFLYSGNLRRDLEGLVLLKGSISKCREELLGKYPDHLVPSEQVLDAFCRFFWAVGSMSSEGLFQYLKVDSRRQELVPATKGDLQTTYAMLGLRQRISAEQFYDDVTALAHQTVQSARRNQGMGGNALLGVAALIKQGMDAIDRRESMRQAAGGVEDDLRDQVVAFKLSRVEPARIRSIDEVRAEDREDNRGAIIDVDFSEAQ